MSQWTHVCGIIRVTTPDFLTLEEVATYLQMVVRRLPSITGSERSAQYTVSANVDSNGSRIDDLGDRKYFCEGVISVFGDLRDRIPDETSAEVSDMFNALDRWVLVDDAEIVISTDETGGKVQYSTSLPNIKRKDFVVKRVDTSIDHYHNFSDELHKNWDEYKRKCASSKKYMIAELIGSLDTKELEQVLECSSLMWKIDWDYSREYLKDLIKTHKPIPSGYSKEDIKQLREEVKRESVEKESDNEKK